MHLSWERVDRRLTSRDQLLGFLHVVREAVDPRAGGKVDGATEVDERVVAAGQGEADVAENQMVDGAVHHRTDRDLLAWAATERRYLPRVSAW